LHTTLLFTKLKNKHFRKYIQVGITSLPATPIAKASSSFHGSGNYFTIQYPSQNSGEQIQFERSSNSHVIKYAAVKNQFASIIIDGLFMREVNLRVLANILAAKFILLNKDREYLIERIRHKLSEFS